MDRERPGSKILVEENLRGVSAAVAGPPTSEKAKVISDPLCR
jgi:hypothetical protein